MADWVMCGVSSRPYAKETRKQQRNMLETKLENKETKIQTLSVVLSRHRVLSANANQLGISMRLCAKPMNENR